MQDAGLYGQVVQLPCQTEQVCKYQEWLFHGSARAVHSVYMDPIQHGWELCNPGVPFPAQLERGVAPSTLASSHSSAFRLVAIVRTLAGADAKQKATHTRIVGKLPTRSKPRFGQLLKDAGR
jgi:hypothetical protein